MQVIGTMVVIALGAPIVLLVFIPLGFVYRIVMRYYLATSRELKRLDAVSSEKPLQVLQLFVYVPPLLLRYLANGIGLRTDETIHCQH
jgi:hypothetical protein